MTAARGAAPGARVRLGLALMIVACAAYLRESEIERQGVRFVDEGEYCFFGLALRDGVRGQIIDKPGYALLVAASYALFGEGMASPLRLNAWLGLAAVAALYGLGRRLYGETAGLAAAAVAAAMPLCLFYQRSAMSDGAYFALSCAAMWLALWAFDGGPRRRWLGAAAAGLVFGFSFCVNPSTILFAGCAGAALLLLHRARALGPGAAMLLAAAAAWAGVNAVLRPYLRPQNIADLYRFHAKWVLAFQPSWWFLRNLWAYAGPGPVLAAGLGALLALRRRERGDIAALALLAGLLLFSFRLSIRFPRVYLPLAAPVCLLAGRFASACAARVRRGRAAALAAFCAAALLAGWGPSRRFIRLRSGYDDACRLLAADGVRKGLTTHSWWTFQTFTRRRFSYAGAALASILRRPGPIPVRPFRRMAAAGYTHLVIDYLFWLDMDAAARRGLERLLREHPPAFVVPNPIVSHEATALEDGKLPALESEPLAQRIYIYRLRDF